MIDECMEGNIDLVITKSISRFARNTLDCLKYIRQLKDKNISVFFEKENINTMDAKGEVLLTIMASLAQQESQSLSQNVKLGLQYRYQQGKVQVNHNRFMGYTKDEEGNLIIVPEEAEIIKRIYREYLEGKSLAGIGRDLEKDGILTAAGKPRWRPETIKKILMNEKYIGDALLQKTFTVDFLTKKRVKNEGHVPQYYVENSHEAIIPKELFLQAQEELHRRNNIYTGADKNKRLYSSKYALSTITFCGDCGDIYRRVYWNIRGRKEFVWRCVTRIEQGPETCKNRTVKEGDLYDAVMTAINRLLAGGDNMIRTLEENIHAVIGDTTEYQISEINNLLEEKQKEVISLANKGKDYEFLADEIDKLREKRQSLLVEDASLSGENERIEELIEIIRKNKYRTQRYDGALVRKLIQNVTVYDDHFVICFKSGIEVEV
jgi:DNA invertase Pin-like site-specific DNA recombinase